jgi:type IX secretion system PorP/SprF family membrane protein
VKKIIYHIVLGCVITCLCSNESALAQDPAFSQLFNTPLSINPALSGSGDQQWRINTNFRKQTLPIGTSFNTRYLSADGKIQYQKNSPNYIGLGMSFFQDEAMEGVFKSNWFSFNSAIHLKLDAEEIHGITGGLGFIYNKTNINFESLTTGQQLGSSGFVRAVNTGEPLLNNIPGVVSASAGIVYTFTTEETFADIGFAGYRFIKNKQTVFENGLNYISPRYSMHFSYGKLLNDRSDIVLMGYAQTQDKVALWTMGGQIGWHLSEDPEILPSILRLGIMYHNTKVIAPIINYSFRDIQIGLSYDIFLHNNASATRPNAFELSLVYRHFRNSRNPLFW